MMAHELFEKLGYTRIECSELIEAISQQMKELGWINEK